MKDSILISLSKEELIAEMGSLIDSKLSKLDLSPKIQEAKLLSQKEAAEFLKISEATLIKFKKEGKISYTKMGKRYYFSKDELISNMYKVKGGVN